MATQGQDFSTSNGATEPRPVTRDYVATLSAALDVLNARLFVLLAVIGAVAMFAYAVVDPMPWRTYTVGSYAAVVLWPLVWMMARKG